MKERGRGVSLADTPCLDSKNVGEEKIATKGNKNSSEQVSSSWHHKD